MSGGPIGGAVASVVGATGNVSGAQIVADPTVAAALAGAGAVTSVVGATGAVTGAQIVADTTVAAALAAKAPLVESVNTVATSGAAQTIPDPSTTSLNRITLTAACTLTFPTATAGKSFTLVLVQDATGSRTVTWPASAKWAGGTAPTLTTTAAAVDYLTFVCVDGSTWAGFVAGLDVK